MNKYILPSENKQYEINLDYMKLKKYSMATVCSPYDGLLKLKFNFKVFSMETACRINVTENVGHIFGEILNMEDDNFEYMDKEVEFIAKSKSGMPIMINVDCENGYLENIKVCYDKILIREEI